MALISLPSLPLQTVSLRDIDDQTCPSLTSGALVVRMMIVFLMHTVDHGRFAASPCGDPNGAHGFG